MTEVYKISDGLFKVVEEVSVIADNKVVEKMEVGNIYSVTKQVEQQAFDDAICAFASRLMEDGDLIKEETQRANS